MKKALLSIYRAVAEGRLAQTEAIVRIKALKRQASDAAQGVLLATPEWVAASATSAPAQPVDRIFVWGVDPAVTASLKATHGDARFEAFAPPANVTAADEIFADAALQGLAAIQSMLAGARSVRALVIVADRGVDEKAADEAVACGFDAMFRTRLRAGTVSQRSRRLEKKSAMRSGASRKSMAFRVGGVSTTMRS